MTLDWKNALLLWDRDDPRRFGLDVSRFHSKGIQTLEIRYERVGRDPDLVREVKATGAQALIFTRNDEMAGRPAIGDLLAASQMGYTCISGIDRVHEDEQTRQCIGDFLGDKIPITIPPPEQELSVGLKRQTDGSFSLVFDLEQLGGARFGLPRLLPLLATHGIKATFFVTGIIASLYPEILERISADGHEIGAHGSMHEFLQGRAPEEQVLRIRDNVNSLSAFADVKGANFIYRMDRLSPEAMLMAGVDYFAIFRKHLPYRSRYVPASCRPRFLRTGSGDITFIPISAETYGGNFELIKGQIDSAWKTARREESQHISVLMHPFKDGGLARMPLTAHILRYLIEELNLCPVTLNTIRAPSKIVGRAVQVAYRWDGFEPGSKENETTHPVTRSWWAPVIYHSARAENLVDALHQEGRPAILSSDPSPEEPVASVFPDGGPAEDSSVTEDPLLKPRNAAVATIRSLKTAMSVRVSPPRKWADLWNFVRFHVPHTRNDLLLFIGKIRARFFPDETE